MIICKGLNPKDCINSIDEWFQKCPPQSGIKQWKDGRSAKETAKHWTYVIPEAFTDILKQFKLTYNLCSPEYNSAFDNYRGNARNHDLLIIAEDQLENKTVISIESKVDEPFDKSVGEYMDIIQNKKNNNIPTNADKRINGLVSALLGNVQGSVVEELSYQLLTAVAGTLSEAKKQNAVRAVFLVQTFLSSDMKSENHRKNQRDLDFFLEVISNCNYKILHDGDIAGPINIPGNNSLIPNNIELWIGKYSIKI